ncbi:MAG: type II toxin-antitoxin system RelB/DinJ family antitoxin [Planctomycetota bacterium]|jgi:DNA-damage-inducible protein J|nr:type II toxin-antitoxin system RelB/DinJ family antitoxin [Planctomycetota bacterium]
MPTIQFRTDATTKAQAVEIFHQLGITMSDAINMFLRQSILHGGLPFELKLPRYNAVTEAALREGDEAFANGKLKRYSNTKEMFTDILAKDDAGEV